MMKKKSWRDYLPFLKNPDHVYGIDEMADIRKRLPQFEMQVIFDVGANTGQSAIAFHRAWPHAQIHSFEPFQYAHTQLEQNTRGKNVLCHRLALGAAPGHLTVDVTTDQEKSNRNSLRSDNRAHISGDAKSETVEVTTIDQFCTTHQIHQIDFLKIDTEGYDLEVLKGAESMLRSASIHFIQTEISMNPRNTLHVDLHSMSTHLWERGYFLFGIYHQTYEWKPKKPVLRRADVVYVSSKWG